MYHVVFTNMTTHNSESTDSSTSELYYTNSRFVTPRKTLEGLD